LNSWLQYNHAIGDFEISVAYTHLRYFSDDAHDNEVGLGLEYGALPWNLAASALGYYSFEAEGTFFELGLNGEYEIKPWLTLSPNLVFGINSGYISDGHNGANNLEMGLVAEIPLSDRLSLYMNGSYNFAINSDPDQYAGDESLDNFFYGGVSLTYSF
jgi:predicted porin